MYFEFPIPFMPPFLKVDLSGAVVLIGAFIFGIAPAITMIGIKDIIHLTQTQTGEMCIRDSHCTLHNFSQRTHIFLFSLP